LWLDSEVIAAMLELSSTPGGGWLVKCDGCSRETLAEIFPDRIVVFDRRHGVKHVAVVPKCEILRAMGACPVESVSLGTHGRESKDIAVNN
jgi:hypothetical protein